MNATETQAYAWLQRQGYTPEGINFSSRRSPDFLTADGKGWEIKLSRSNTITFSSGQVARLNKVPEVSVVVFNDHKAGDPVLVFPFAGVPVPGYHCGYRLVEAEASNGQYLTVRLTDDEQDLLRNAALRDQRTLSQYVRIHLIAQALRDLGREA